MHKDIQGDVDSYTRGVDFSDLAFSTLWMWEQDRD